MNFSPQQRLSKIQSIHFINIIKMGYYEKINAARTYNMLDATKQQDDELIKKENIFYKKHLFHLDVYGYIQNKFEIMKKFDIKKSTIYFYNVPIDELTMYEIKSPHIESIELIKDSEYITTSKRQFEYCDYIEFENMHYETKKDILVGGLDMQEPIDILNYMEELYLYVIEK